MRKLRDLSRAELEGIVEFCVVALWTDDVKEPPEKHILGFAPDREWSPDEVEMIATHLAGLGLRPETPESPDEAIRLLDEWCATRSDPAP